MYKQAFIILLLLSSLPQAAYSFDSDRKPAAHAQLQDLTAAANAVYHHHFWKYDTINNMPWDCGGNSYDLFLEMQKVGALTRQQKIFIVHQFYEKDFKFDNRNQPLSRMLIPLKPRAGHDKWAFHAVLIIDGLVFDQYFTNQPRILGFDKYIQKMWGAENQDDLRFQIVPATQYHEIAARGYSINNTLFPILNFQQAKEILEP